MKKTKLIVFLVAIIGAITLFVIGMVLSDTVPVISSNKPPIETIEPTQPTNTLEVPSGTYYYVMGTHTAYTGDETHLQSPADSLPFIQITKNHYVLSASDGRTEGEAYSDENKIIFDNQELVQNLINIDTEHDELWYTLYYPKQELAWQCTYDASTRTITIAHNSDFAEFRFFETEEQYTTYIRETFMQDGYFEIYPTPHDVEGDMPGAESSN